MAPAGLEESEILEEAEVTAHPTVLLAPLRVDRKRAHPGSHREPRRSPSHVEGLHRVFEQIAAPFGEIVSAPISAIILNFRVLSHTTFRPVASPWLYRIIVGRKTLAVDRTLADSGIGPWS